MLSTNLRPDLITLLSLLPALASLASLSSVREVHAFALRSSLAPHPHLSSALVESYARCGSLPSARHLFDEIPHPDPVAYTSMLSAYALHGDAGAAVFLFDRMLSAGSRPDGVAFLVVLQACSHSGRADEAMQYFKMMARGDFDVEVTRDHYSCLVDVLGRAGRLREAYGVLRGMPMEASAKAWGALLGACKTYGEVELAEVAGRVLFEMEPENSGNFLQLASVYARAERFEEAERVRREMRERGMRRVPGRSWVLSQPLANCA